MAFDLLPERSGSKEIQQRVLAICQPIAHGLHRREALRLGQGRQHYSRAHQHTCNCKLTCCSRSRTPCASSARALRKSLQPRCVPLIVRRQGIDVGDGGLADALSPSSRARSSRRRRAKPAHGPHSGPGPSGRQQLPPAAEPNFLGCRLGKTQEQNAKDIKVQRVLGGAVYMILRHCRKHVHLLHE